MYCLLQKIESSRLLPLVQKWQALKLPNNSLLPPIEEEHFLESTHIQVALEKVRSHYPKSEFRKKSLQFLEDCVQNVLSVVTGQSLTGQRLSFRCLEIKNAGDDPSAFFLFWLLLDEFLERSWIRGLVVEPATAKFQSIVREQRVLEQPSTKKRHDVVPYCLVVSLRLRFVLARTCVA